MKKVMALVLTVAMAFGFVVVESTSNENDTNSVVDPGGGR